MKGVAAKYLFNSLAAVLLVIMLFSARSAGISCDEMIHYGHSVEVYNYFTSGGSDRSALDTPVTNLKYYGQSYDNFVTFVTKWFNIDDVYTFRNLMSALMGWLTILAAGLLATWLGNYKTGIITLFFLAVTPAFFGHSLNNLKDIPFAFAYISGIFLSFRFLQAERGRLITGLLLTLCIAFCISIRAGGLILICYLWFFLVVKYFIKYLHEGKTIMPDLFRITAWIATISIVSFFLSALMLWPYALQHPVRNIFESYRIMAHYPATFRQIFEGKVEWSDFMPWYYLFKSMAITIPVVVLSGLILFIFFIKKTGEKGKSLFYGFLAFTVIFPMIFVIAEKSNLYSSWRQFLFVFPGMVILAASGISFMLESPGKKYIKLRLLVLVLLASVNPVNYMIGNHPYEYIYYNELAGGLKGAYAKYETDYYYTSQTEASGWLIDHIEKNNIKGKIKVQATYPVDWFFRDHPEVSVSWFRYEERSMHDWDYAIVVNRYIPPYQLEKGIWPPENAIHLILAGGVPICAVLERRSKEDLMGYEALKAEKYPEAIDHFSRAIEQDDGDEMIFYNFAGALYRNGQKQEADSALKRGLEINPGSEVILMYLGNIAVVQGRKEDAIGYYKKVIAVNRKYFEAYVALSEQIADSDVRMARSLLRECLKMHPGFRPAIMALGDTYSSSNPDIARKYYERANSINQ